MDNGYAGVSTSVRRWVEGLEYIPYGTVKAPRTEAKALADVMQKEITLYIPLKSNLSTEFE